MSEWISDQVFTLGILGAGRGGLGLLKLFGESEVTKVLFVSDMDPAAPGAVEAKARGITVFSSVDEAIRGSLPDFLFDSTNDPEVEAKLKERLRGTATRLITPLTCRMMVEVLTRNATKVREDVAEVVTAIQRDLGESRDASQSVVGRINSILSTMQMLALNASIEAAKAGVHGRGFRVVAEHLGRSVDAVRNLTLEINQVNQNIVQVAEKSSEVLGKLR